MKKEIILIKEKSLDSIRFDSDGIRYERKDETTREIREDIEI